MLIGKWYLSNPGHLIWITQISVLGNSEYYPTFNVCLHPQLILHILHTQVNNFSFLLYNPIK
jgi:hypothetical protein